MNSVYQPDRSLPAKIKRRLTQWRTAAPVDISPDQPLITMTFDDFPRTAARRGAELMDQVGGKATYYACTSLVEKSGVMGRMFAPDDLQTLHDEGHEIGAHTHTHLDCAQAEPQTALDDTDRNLISLGAMGFHEPVTSFAFPFGETRFDTKKTLASRFTSLRGILPGLNRGRADRAQLRAFELDGRPETVERAHAAIETAARSNAWLILFTHDVSDRPSPFGVASDDLARLLHHARDAGLAFRTMRDAIATGTGAAS